MSDIRWEAVRFTWPDGVIALDGIDLEAHDGEVLLVAGDAGSGKSTLLRTVNGLVPHSTGGRFGGEVLVGGRSTRHNRPRDFADVVGFVHQDPEAHFVVDRVEHDIAFVLENLGTDAVSMRRRIEEVLDALGIAHLRHRSPATLSSGERQRCAVAGALASGPRVLVLDEPTSMLDPQGADDVFAAVTRLNADLGTTVVLAEHRLERAAPLADRAVLVVSGSGGGSTQAPGDPAAVLSGYAGAPTVTHLGRVLGWEPPPLTIRQARSLARTCPPQLGVPGAGESCTGAASAPGEVLVAASGLEAAPGPAVVLHAVDLEVRAGEVVALLGRNGSGKTTLLRCLAGLLHPRKGRIDRRAAVAYVPQDPNALLFADTVRAELVETTRLLGRRDPRAVERWLATMGLEALAARHPRSLSAGQRQRVAIAAVAVGGAPVLLLDEPTRGIDAPSRAALEVALTEHAAGGGAAVLATHDVELAARCATRVVVLGDGEVVAAGRAREVLSGSLFAPQVLRVLPPFLTVGEVEAALGAATRPT